MTTGRVTVFGGTGFLGRHVVRQLAAVGRPVRVAVRRPERAEPLAGAAAEIEPFYVDVRDEASVALAVAGSTGAVNAVGLYVEKGAETFLGVHVLGALNVARQTARAGVERLIHVSGIGSDPRSPSAYVRARAAGEQQVAQEFEAATIFRPSVLIAERGGLLATLDSMSRYLPVLPLFGRGATRLQPVHAGDVALAAERALGDPASRGETYELGGGSIHSYRDLLQLVLRHNGRSRLLLPVPFAVWEVLAWLMRPLPNPPVTSDMIALMRHDNVAGAHVLGFRELGIAPKSVEDVLAAAVGPKE